ncbi:MauE/DoxX family redox-associated membrane protein [Streptomyces sp. NPDC056669]|uniref:MauE/DoxX family redox-associated membrane protein n=1 Tax=Streptomyces sp. NPDC056669 TaxID=3345903 RepID=UPI00369CBAA2
MNWTLLGAVGALGSGFVLLNAGWWKLRHRPAFTLVLSEQGRAVAALAAWLAWALPVAELAVGVGAMALVLPPSARAGPALPPMWLPMLGMALLGGIFTGYAGVQLARGRRPRCGCLNSDDRFGAHTVVRALAIGLGGVGGWCTAATGTDSLPPPVWMTAVVTGGLMVAVVLLVGLPLLADLGLADLGRSAHGDRDRPGGHQLADHRRARHLPGDQQSP